MKKIVSAIALLAAAALAGCTDNERVGYDIESKVLLPKNGLQQIALTPTAAEVAYDVWIYRSGYNGGGSTAGLKVDAAALAAYNKANGTAYEPMPESYYTLPAASVRLDNDDNAAKITVELDVSAIAAGSLYVLPLSVSSPDTQVSNSAASVLLCPVRPQAEEPEKE